MESYDKEIIAWLNLQYVMLNWWNVFCYVIFYDFKDGDYLRIKHIPDTVGAKELLKSIGLDIFYDGVESMKAAASKSSLAGGCRWPNVV